MGVAAQQMHVAGAHLGQPLEELLVAGAPRLLPGRLPGFVGAEAVALGQEAPRRLVVLLEALRVEVRQVQPGRAPHGSGRPSRSRGRSGFWRASRGTPVLPVASCGMDVDASPAVGVRR